MPQRNPYLKKKKKKEEEKKKTICQVKRGDKRCTRGASDFCSLRRTNTLMNYTAHHTV